jgi:hypothetical protein
VNNFFRNANLIDDSDRLLTRGDFRPDAQDSVFVRYIYLEPRPPDPRRVRRRHRRHGTSAFGNQKIKTNAIVGGWTRVLSSRWSTKSGSRGRGRVSDAVQQAYG